MVQERTREYIEENIASMLARPSMWGSYESVELQILTLLEVLMVDARDELSPDAATAMMREEYFSLLRERFPADRGRRAAVKSLERDGIIDEDEFRSFMTELRDRVLAKLEQRPSPIEQLLMRKHSGERVKPPSRSPVLGPTHALGAAE